MAARDFQPHQHPQLVALMNRILAGDANPTTAILRGELNASGRLELLTYFLRLLP